MAESPSSQTSNVLEGFLCPICLSDLKTINQLHEHFEVAHGSEDQDVFQALKGFFGKAKRKILKQEAGFEESNRVYEEANILPYASYQPYDYELSSQDLGITVSHTLIFKEMRENKIHTYIIETNKLLIRLDKLISEAPEDPEKRKAHEKSVVPWVADADVRLCPGCGKSFGLSRRRHHCRLCGAVMCQTCSQFIDFAFARKLTQPIVQDDHQLAIPVFSPLQRRGSNTSLLSVVNFAGEPHIRVCRDCKTLLVRRKAQLEDHGQKAIIVQKYERMREYMAEIEKLEPLYIQMIEALCDGEMQYHLRDAQELKIKISKMAEGIDAISKVIAKLECPEEESSSKALQLQSSIRVVASQFLRNAVLGMPQIPTENELSRYRKLREEKIQRQIQLEKEAELQELQTQSKVPSTPKSLNMNAKSLNYDHKQEHKTEISPDSGWSASPGNFVEEGNAMLQQINIIRKYIKQARLDRKYDEVHMLETNLKELQQEYLKQTSFS